MGRAALQVVKAYNVMTTDINTENTVCVGIDVSKDTLQICVKVSDDARTQGKIVRTFKVPNNATGFAEIVRKTEREPRENTLYVMEATGVYHECLADFLHEKGLHTFVENATAVKNFARYRKLKTKTDRTDASVIAEYGLRTPMKEWHPFTPELAALRSLSREIQFLTERLSALKSQYHALLIAAHTYSKVLDAHLKVITVMEETRTSLRNDLMELVLQNGALDKKVRDVATIPGVKPLTVIQVACETNGFRECRNIRSLTSYAGLDVVQYQSGTIDRKTHISKKGNARIRRLLYMPALTAARFNENVQRLYKRVVERNPESKKKAVVASMRKLLILIYTLWKDGTTFEPGHIQKRDRQIACLPR